MKIVICGATGFIGRNLIPALLKESHHIVVVGRYPKKAKTLFKDSVAYLSWEELEKSSPDDVDSIINLVGENIANNRWTAKVKNIIKASRVNSIEKITTWCLKSKTKKPHIYNASAIGIYGLQTVQTMLPRPLKESHSISFGTPTDFLSDIGQACESAANTLIAARFPVTFMRFAVVLKRHEGILKKLELPFSLGLGSILGSGNQAFTWIDIDDLVNAILFLLVHPEITGAVNICSPCCISQKLFAQTLANVMHRPLFLKMPAFMISILFGQMGEELLLGGQNIYPERLEQYGFKFRYSTIENALLHEWTR